MTRAEIDGLPDGTRLWVLCPGGHEGPGPGRPTEHTVRMPAVLALRKVVGRKGVRWVRVSGSGIWDAGHRWPDDRQPHPHLAYRALAEAEPDFRRRLGALAAAVGRLRDELAAFGSADDDTSGGPMIGATTGRPEPAGVGS